MPIEEDLYKPATYKDYNGNEIVHKVPCIAFQKHAQDILLGNMLPFGIRRLSLINMPWPIVMSERRKWATITIDNVREGHYGLAGTESLSQGIPSIAWNHPTTIEQLAMIGGNNPFIEASSIKEATLHAITWAKDTQMATDYGLQCRAWIEEYYHSKKLIEKFWEPFCDDLLKG